VRALQAFVAVAELGSFRAAGDAMFLEASTISKLVARLEASLGGTRLLARSTRKVSVTLAGAAALQTAHEVLAALERFHAAAARPPS
jgi:DNA-binding transcriptional LysR family regulator